MTADQIAWLLTIMVIAVLVVDALAVVGHAVVTRTRERLISAAVARVEGVTHCETLANTWIGAGKMGGVPTSIRVTLTGGDRRGPPEIEGITWRRP